ncbi:hypothetical protein GGX14DRAFT_387474 [Mycena pura]|uniref:Uncharacterized protein n=1 Tax=Mycena pura TaxID=153505 RepID=A0AAD6YLX6_9AGAR|nr:hypothetical protein GGX14DRAFT_387474 [Mycena pura]
MDIELAAAGTGAASSMALACCQCMLRRADSLIAAHARTMVLTAANYRLQCPIWILRQRHGRQVQTAGERVRNLWAVRAHNSIRDRIGTQSDDARMSQRMSPTKRSEMMTSASQPFPENELREDDSAFVDATNKLDDVEKSLDLYKIRDFGTVFRALVGVFSLKTMATRSGEPSSASLASSKCRSGTEETSSPRIALWLESLSRGMFASRRRMFPGKKVVVDRDI